MNEQTKKLCNEWIKYMIQRPDRRDDMFYIYIQLMRCVPWQKVKDEFSDWDENGLISFWGRKVDRNVERLPEYLDFQVMFHGRFLEVLKVRQKARNNKRIIEQVNRSKPENQYYPKERKI